MICHKYKCIFIHIPKVAGTSIITAFNKKWSTDETLFLLGGNCTENVSEWNVYKNKYVDVVYENGPLVITDQLLESLNADYVVAGRENEDYIKKYYQVHIDKLHLIERTPDISSSMLRKLKFV